VISKGMVKMGALTEDIELMANFLDRDDPAIKRLLKTYVRDPKMRETIRIILKRRCVKAGFDPDDMPVFWPVRQLPAGKLHVGQVIQGNMPGPRLCLPSGVITQHLGIFGHNGTGKSYLTMYLVRQAIRAGLTVWIFDIEDEYSRLIPELLDGQLTALEPEQLRFNIFQPPGDLISPAGWLDELSLFLRGATFLRDGSLNIFRNGMTRLFERKGINDGGSEWPSLLEVIDYFGNLKFGPKTRSAGYIESLLNRLVTIANYFDKTAGVSKSDMLANLAGRSVIFRLHGLVGLPLQSLVSFLLLWLARFREAAENTKPHGAIIEEAHMLSSEKSRQDIGEGVLSRMFRTARKRGIALILCDQVPSELPPAILGNLACRITMRLASARYIWSMQNSMGLDRKQADVISKMKPRHAVVHYTLNPTAFAIEIPQITLPEKTRPSKLHQDAEELLSKSQWTKAENARERITASAAKMLAPDDLAGDAFSVMARICQQPAESIDQRCRELRIDRAREFRARAELDDRGLIAKLERTLAGKIRFFQPTDKGTAWAQKRNIHVKKFKSGIVHEYLLCLVEKGIGLTDPKLRLQRNSSIAGDHGLQPDLLVMGPKDRRIIVEICCNNLDYDAENILIETQIPEIDQVIAVTPDKRTRKSIEQALKKNAEDSGKDQQKSITLLDAGLCLADDFDWAGVLVGGSQKLFPDS